VEFAGEHKAIIPALVKITALSQLTQCHYCGHGENSRAGENARAQISSIERRSNGRENARA
jgi:hypothetical protein